MSLQALNVFVPAAWLAAAMLHLPYRENEPGPRETWIRRGLTILATALHVWLFVTSWQALGRAPLHDAWSTLSCTLLMVALLHFATTRSIDSGSTGAIVLLLLALGQLAASAFSQTDMEPYAPRPGTFYLFHVFASVTAAAAVLLSGVHGGFYLLLFRRMRRGRLEGIVRGLPSLETLAQLTRRAALAGFLLLTIGVNWGIGWAHYAGVPGFHYSDPGVLFVIAVWLHFGFVAFSRQIPGFSARRASVAAAAGLTVFVSIFLLTLIPELSFHWSVG